MWEHQSRWSWRNSDIKSALPLAPKPNAAWDKLGIRQVPFDINDSATMTGALKGGEAFFSLTPLVENLVQAGSNAIRASPRLSYFGAQLALAFYVAVVVIRGR